MSLCICVCLTELVSPRLASEGQPATGDVASSFNCSALITVIIGWKSILFCSCFSHPVSSSLPSLPGRRRAL